MIQFVHFA